jgi:hypothetical protein
MQLKVRHLGLSILFVLAGCNDARVVDPATNLQDLPGRAVAGSLIPKIKIRFDQKQTITQQMFINGASMYLSGRPFGFSSWDIGSNPLSPRLQFAFSDNIESFAAPGNVSPSWNTDYYASQAMGAIGRYVLTSGLAGASLLDTGVSNQVVELARHPIRTGNDNQVPADPNYIYKAIISDPNQGYFYGFTEQNGYVPLKLQSNDVVMQTQAPVAYSANGQKGTCCVLGGATFQNNIFIAFRSSLRQFAFAGNGNLRQVSVFNDLDATNIVASNNFLFIQHQAIPGNGYPSGIYVIDGQGNSVVFLPINPISFAVSPDNNYLYANLDNDSITVYQINWQAIFGSGY